MAEKKTANSVGVRGLGLLILAVLVLNGRHALQAKTAEADLAAERSGILWQDPGNIGSRDLFYGIGGMQNAPKAASYTFVKEDEGNSAPKFIVKDSNGIRWKVKLGPEARGEIAATRIVWAAGYFTDEDYFLPQLQVDGLPPLHRGQEWVRPGCLVANARLEREIEGQKKVGYWKWKGDDWLNTQQLDGLKVVMALINNWDLKDNNTAIYKQKNPEGREEYIYAVGDLGASFGRTHLDRVHSKADLGFYESSKFMGKVSDDEVHFATPGGPTLFLLVNPKDYFYRRELMSITHHVSRSDARRIGQLLSGLSPQQIRDAFRAGGFSDQEMDGFTGVVQKRIGLLAQL
jgi:hypothetical protein